MNPNIQRDNLKWRVLDVKDGKVRLISAEPTTSKMELKGYNGYNNAVKLLDDACNTLYNNSKLASKVQNLKIEDIQDKMLEKDYTKIYSNYGKIFTPSNKYYPSILLKEKEQTVTVGENTTTGTELDFSMQNDLINQIEGKQAETLNTKYTFWNKKIEKGDFFESKYYELFINNGENYNTYWMSSRCISADTVSNSFNIRNVYCGEVNASGLYSSSANEYSRDYAFRPVVTLNSNVQVTSGNEGSETQINIQ